MGAAWAILNRCFWCVVLGFELRVRRFHQVFMQCERVSLGLIGFQFQEGRLEVSGVS